MGRSEDGGGGALRSFALFDAMSELVAVARLDRVLYVNPPARALLGGEEPTGRSPLELVAREDRERVRAMYERVLATGEPAPLDSYTVLAGDRVAVLDVTLARVQLEDGPAVLSVARDVTAAREREARGLGVDLLAAFATLAAGVIHELNNPLAYVTMNLTAIARSLATLADGASPAQAPRLAELTRLVGETADGVERLVGTVRDLKIFARVDGERAAPLDVRAALEATLNLVSSELRHRGRLRRDYGVLPRVHAQPGRLAQLLLALFDHAVRALPERGRERNELWVRARGVPGGVEIVVRDNGPGLAPEALTRLFAPPQRGRAGLGLAVCRGLVAELGGRLDVSSEAGEREGTRYSLFLPSNEPMPRAGRSPPPVAAAAPRPRLLIVDDEPNLVRALSLDLERDHQVSGVTSGREALELLARVPFDLILCDLMMQDILGMELHAELERRGGGLDRKLVFMTGGAWNGAVRSFLETTQIPWIEKPFRMDALREVLAETYRSGGKFAPPDDGP